MKQFLRDNLVIVLAAALPLLMMLAFVALGAIDQKNAVQPGTAVVFALSPYYPPNDAYDATVDGQGRIAVTYTRPDNKTYGNFDQPLRIVHYDPATQTVASYDIPAPRNAAAGRTIKLRVPDELTALRIDPTTPSPDGFTFGKVHRRGNGNIVTDIFGYNSYSGGMALGYARDGRHYPIPGDFSYSHVTVIGWVVP